MAVARMFQDAGRHDAPEATSPGTDSYDALLGEHLMKSDEILPDPYGASKQSQLVTVPDDPPMHSITATRAADVEPPRTADEPPS